MSMEMVQKWGERLVLQENLTLAMAVVQGAVVLGLAYLASRKTP